MISAEQSQILDKIKSEIEAGLPGVETQNLLSPIVSNDKYRKAPSNHKVACVMALLYPENGKMHMIFIERTSHHPDDKHAGQISFPGGKMESGDRDHLDCALREVEEEIGIHRSDITVLGDLTDLYVFASNFLVFPFIGYLHSKPKYSIQIEEVASVITYPVADLIIEDIIKTKDLKVREYTMKDVPYYDLNGHTLWGATAMITSEVLELVKRALR